MFALPNKTKCGSFCYFPSLSPYPPLPLSSSSDEVETHMVQFSLFALGARQTQLNFIPNYLIYTPDRIFPTLP